MVEILRQATKVNYKIHPPCSSNSNSVLHACIKFEGTTFLLSSKKKNPFSYFFRLDLGLGSIHSDSSSLNRDRPVNNLNDALNLFDEMSQRRPLQSVVKFTQLLNSVTKLNINPLPSLFKQICSLGVHVNHYTMSIAIKCCFQLHRINDAFALLGYCFRRAIVPTVCTFNTLLNARILDAEKLFKKLIKHDICEPNIVTYSTMLQGLFRVGQCGAARKLFDEMHALGVVPNAIIYGIMLEGLCNNHLMEDALSLFKMMGDSKLNSNIVVYNIFIDGASKCGKFDVAKDVFHDLSLKGLQPNVGTYNVMISSFCREGLVNDAKQFFHKMEDNICAPDKIITLYR